MILKIIIIALIFAFIKKKLIFESKICILNCSYPFQFEYNNICYSSCPNGTYNMANNQCILNDINYGITISSNFFNNDNNYNFTSIHLYWLYK